MLSIIDQMDLKKKLRPLRTGDVYEVNGRSYYSEELVFEYLRVKEESEVDEDERMGTLNAAVDNLIAERDEARTLAGMYRDMLQACGVLFERELLPWEEQ